MKSRLEIEWVVGDIAEECMYLEIQASLAVRLATEDRFYRRVLPLRTKGLASKVL